MMNQRNNIQGYLTVFLSLLLAAFLGFIMVLSEGIKRNTIRTESEIAMDTACYSALAEYHRELLEQYDLFFIDSSYGHSVPGASAVSNHIKQYARKNLEGTGFLDIETQSMEMEAVLVSTDMECMPMKQQIVDYMKRQLSIDLVEKVVEGYEKTCETSLDQNEILKRRDENKRALEQAPNPTRIKKHKKKDPKTGKVSITEEIEEVPIVDPAEGVNQQRSAGILNWVVKDTTSLSRRVGGQESCFSHREPKIQGTDIPFIEADEQQLEREESMLVYFEERALLNQYLFEKCGYYGNEKPDSRLKYQIEYLIAKKDSDLENLKTVVTELALMREASNAVYLLSDPAKKAEITALASTVAAVALAPYLEPMIETSILFAWAYVESLQDIKILLEGGRIPLVKTASDWNTGLAEAMNLKGTLGSGRSDRGLNYRGYLTILLAAQTEPSQLEYLADLIEMDIRETKYNENFRIDGCIGAFHIKGGFRERSGYACSIDRIYSY